MEDLEFAKQQLAILQYNIEQLKYTRKARIISSLLFASFAPYFILLRSIIFFTSLVSKNIWKRCIFRYLHLFFKLYFYFKGLVYYKTIDFPKNVSRPTIIITTRRNPASPFFLFHLFDFPVIIPLSKYLMAPWKIHFFPMAMKNLFETVSFPDIPLSDNLSNIDKLLEGGYPVIVHINHHYIDPISTRTPYFYKELNTLLEKNADIYFLNLDNYWRYKFSTVYTKNIISCDLIKKEKLLENIPANNINDLYFRIANFFGFTDFKVL
ncbi:MAG: hypothetical protein GY730_08495 [bacterium]|nr:hypothetical protein [bacterium]